ncbi:MAG: hypothetical protein AAF488_05200 [Planctomycetota bacterium]
MIQSSGRGFQEPFVRQITFFLQNKVGELGDVLRHVEAEGIVVHSVSVLDGIDCAVVRFVVDRVDATMKLLYDSRISATENAVIAVPLPNDGSSLLEVCRALLSAEINLHYMYPMITRMHDRGIVLIHVDDADTGVEVLERRGFEIIGHNELLTPEDDEESGAW